jgi:hypothetical protein
MSLKDLTNVLKPISEPKAPTVWKLPVRVVLLNDTTSPPQNTTSWKYNVLCDGKRAWLSSEEAPELDKLGDVRVINDLDHAVRFTGDLAILKDGKVLLLDGFVVL